VKKSLIVATAQLALALSVTGKFVYDRETLPRQWMRAEPFDPMLPLRGRYVRLQLRGEHREFLHSVVFFIPPDVPDPSRRPPGEELWVEVSLPKNGAPRPIRLGVKKNGNLTPLDLR
jgi:hypothetical protein